MRPESRSPAARLIRARSLSANWEQSKPTHCYEDRLVLGYAKFLHELDSLDGQQHDRYLALRPVMSELHYLISATETLVGDGRSRMPFLAGQPPLQQADLPASAASKDRALVRAFVLGNLPAAEIADILDFRTETIEGYEALAFDVRGRLHKKAWLHNHVFGESLLCTTSAMDFERLCLLMVYKHGVEALKRLLFLGDLSEFVDEMRKQIQIDIAAKAGLSLATMPLNSHTMPELVTGYSNWDKAERELRIRELKDGKGDRTDAPEDLQNSLMAAMHEVGCSIADERVDSGAPAEECQTEEAFFRAIVSVVREMHIEETARA